MVFTMGNVAHAHKLNLNFLSPKNGFLLIDSKVYLSLPTITDPAVPLIALIYIALIASTLMCPAQPRH
jgi:hypothetical protein